MPFEVVQREILYRGKVFNIRQDHVRLPDGKLAKWDIIDHPAAVTILPVDSEGLIWFIRQYRHPAGKELLELPAGVLEEDEDPEMGAQREIREEIGMSADDLEQIGSFFLAPGYSTEYMHVFLGRSLRHEPLAQDEDEFIRVEKMSYKQALETIELGEIQDAKSLVALFLAKPYLE